jgi:hypothetical protein
LEATCQRCHEILREADRYCPVCGLPQLTYVAAETPAALGEEAALNSEGAPSGHAGMTDDIAWRPALKSILMLAVPAGVLCSGLTPIGRSAALGLIWMMGAAAWAVNLYIRRSRSVRLSMASGARIGLLTGLFASWLTLGVNGVSLCVARFVLHQGSRMDSAWMTDTAQKLEANQQMLIQMGIASAQAIQSTQITRSIVLSVEGHAGIMLMDLLADAAFLILFAAIGGALGARLLAQPRRPSA